MNLTETLDAYDHAARLLAALGVEETEATKETPRRMVDALRELTAGMDVDPMRHLEVTFEPEGEDTGMIVVTSVPFTSLCEHHVLPFTGTAAVAYLPAPHARIVGLSKLARLVVDYAARPQVQERLGVQVCDAITSRLDTLGAACLIRSQHMCMTLRGVRATGAEMVTSHLTGLFHTDTDTRSEFLALTAANG